MTYICHSCDEEFVELGRKCCRRPAPKHCVDRDVYGGRGECSCEPCCPHCGSDDFSELVDDEVTQ